MSRTHSGGTTLMPNLAGGDVLAVVDEAAGLDFDGEELLLREGQVERGFGPQGDHRGLAGADGLQDGSGDAGEIHGFHAGHDGVIHAGGHLGVHDHLGEVITRGRGGGGAARLFHDG